MAPSDNEERAAFAVGRIEVNSKREQSSESVGRRLGNSDAPRASNGALRIGLHGQHAVLMHRDSPIRRRLLVKVRSIDRKSARA